MIDMISAWQSRTAGSGDDDAVMSAAVRFGSRSAPRIARSDHLHDPLGRARPLGRPLDEPVGLRPPQLDLARREEVVLRREVAVDRAERDLRPSRDVAHLHRVVPALGGEVQRGVEDPTAARGLVRP